MNIRCLLLGVASIALTASCVGELNYRNPPPNSGLDAGSTSTPDAGTAKSNARSEFESNVASLLGVSCAGCHTGAETSPQKFLGQNNNPATYYDAIELYPLVHGGWDPAVATLITKIAAGHQGITYTPAQITTITVWLNNEKELRDGGGDPPPPSPFAVWASCMNLADWNQSEMARWADLETLNDGPCATCHNDGLEGFNTNANDTLMFELNRLEFISGFFAVAIDPMTDQAHVVPDHDKILRMSTGGGSGSLHPLFDYGLNADHYRYLDDFYTFTEGRRQANVCSTTGGSSL